MNGKCLDDCDFVATYGIKCLIFTGLLLREIKDFWRVALLVSTLLHPDVSEHESSGKDIQLEKRRKTFKLVEDMISKLGTDFIF